MAVIAVPWPPAGRETRVAVVVEIDGPDLVDRVFGGAEPAAEVEIEAFVYALDGAGDAASSTPAAVLDQRGRRLAVDWP